MIHNSINTTLYSNGMLLCVESYTTDKIVDNGGENGRRVKRVGILVGGILEIFRLRGYFGYTPLAIPGYN